MSKMKFIPFLLLTTIGSLVWNTVLTTLGSITGENWSSIADFVSKYSTLTLIILVLAFAVFGYIFYKKRKKC